MRAGPEAGSRKADGEGFPKICPLSLAFARQLSQRESQESMCHGTSLFCRGRLSRPAVILRSAATKDPPDGGFCTQLRRRKLHIPHAGLRCSPAIIHSAAPPLRWQPASLGLPSGKAIRHFFCISLCKEIYERNPGFALQRESPAPNINRVGTVLLSACRKSSSIHDRYRYVGSAPGQRAAIGHPHNCHPEEHGDEGS